LLLLLLVVLLAMLLAISSPAKAGGISRRLINMMTNNHFQAPPSRKRSRNSQTPILQERSRRKPHQWDFGNSSQLPLDGICMDMSSFPPRRVNINKHGRWFLCQVGKHGMFECDFEKYIHTKYIRKWDFWQTCDIRPHWNEGCFVDYPFGYSHFGEALGTQSVNMMWPIHQWWTTN